MPNEDLNCYHKPRLRVDFGDEHVVDISTSTDIYSQDSSKTVFDMLHTWSSTKSYTVTAFLYYDYPVEGSGYYGDTSWKISSYEGVWVSGINSATIIAIDPPSPPPPGGGACPFLYKYNGTWSAENNVGVQRTTCSYGQKTRRGRV